MVRKRDAALVRGRWVITIMRMDVFIMSCVSRSSPPPTHILLLLLLFHSLAHLSSSVCVLQLVDRDLILTLQPHCYSLSCEEGVLWFV